MEGGGERKTEWDSCINIALSVADYEYTMLASSYSIVSVAFTVLLCMKTRLKSKLYVPCYLAKNIPGPDE